MGRMRSQREGDEQNEAQILNCVLGWTNKYMGKHGSTFIYTISKMFLNAYCVHHRHAIGRKYLDPCL